MSGFSAKFIGVDVSKAWLDVAVAGETGVGRFANTDEGVRELIDAWSPQVPKLVLAEATGGYEFRLVRALHRASITIAVVNPRQVRDFARASGRLDKTDAINASLIARFGAVMSPRPLLAIAPDSQALGALMARRRQVIDMLVAEKNRRELADVTTRGWIDETMGGLKSQLAAIDTAIAQTIEQSADLAHRRDILTSVPSVGQPTAAVILVEMPELCVTPAQKAAALAGGAPINHDSGNHCGKHHIGGGRASLLPLVSKPRKSFSV